MADISADLPTGLPAKPCQEPPGMGAALIRGGTIGIVVLFIVTAAGMLALGESVATAIGFGLFVGFWGGIGIGTMAGAISWGMRVSKTDR